MVRPTVLTACEVPPEAHSTTYRLAPDYLDGIDPDAVGASTRASPLFADAAWASSPPSMTCESGPIRSAMTPWPPRTRARLVLRLAIARRAACGLILVRKSRSLERAYAEVDRVLGATTTMADA
ncbi:MAG: hypothetical protein JOY61_18055 [Chloroflexi bacterium]|nr:hypothetical protein [Chloroflexota bacterium]